MERDKICFLDIDGVLCTKKTYYAYISQKWDSTVCSMIKRLCKANGYLIVCSSSWRHDEKRTKAYFKRYKLDDILHPDWRTTTTDLICRGEEIALWISEHNVAEYIIIDDDRDMLDDQLKRLVKTNYDDGLSSSDFEKADKLMGSKVLFK